MSNEQQPNAESQASGNTKPADSGTAEPVVESVEQETESTRKETTLSAGEQEKLKQVYRWKEKVALGQAELSDAPVWVQGLIKEDTAKADEINAAVQKGIEKREQEKRYKDTASQLNELSLPEDKVKEVDEQFKKLSKALPKDEALQAAIKIVGIEMPGELAERHAATIFPSGGRYQINDKKDDLSTQSDDDVVNDVLAHNNRVR